ncbi:MAG: right-handed parallel beta-helix repeat-containing protein [Proteobacteria bacterium]|nr:right-handed parallel beta-helix repeat-containing protein [Pseudomonadota bacterium]MBU4294535.1 right-handed parallel beta-helix repeat-containing protein [Pseudomonadota bacterium]MCG2747071.1 right-handed parallel beta-helix repeat-containing protein [Desulfobulbaceae bacterium]
MPNFPVSGSIYSGSVSIDAGIKISGGSVVITNNTISHNNKRGVYITNGSSAIIRNNTIRHNGDPDDDLHDYGIISLSSTPLITNNIIRNNYGSGVYFAWADSAGAKLINNTIVDNDSDGVWSCCEAAPVIKNNIITGNTAGISASFDAIPEISYNDVWNNSWLDYNAQQGGVASPGPGDISVDPLFDTVNPSKYYLAEGSPCIDAGDPDPVYDDIDGSKNDMGAWGGGFGAPSSSSAALASGFVFTTIGKIPVSEITQGLGDQKGLANVSSAVHTDLGIPMYTDSPFGGKLWLSGLFGTEDTSVRYYQILAAKWTGTSPPVEADFQLLKDPLTKIKYIINTDGTVTAQRVTLGPLSQYSMEGLYERTNIGYWAHSDLKLIWDTTRVGNGVYDIMVKAYRLSGIYPFYTLEEVSLPYNAQERITVTVNNSPVTATIHSVHYNNGLEIPECAIIGLTSNTENLKFYITASHPDGFLLQYHMEALYGKNNSAGYVTSDKYTSALAAIPPVWYGVTNQEVDSLTAMKDGMLAPWEQCAYQFRLRVWARTTDGYNYIRSAEFNDHYYLQFDQVNTCPGDIDNSGAVDGLDVMEMSTDYGRTDCLN